MRQAVVELLLLLDGIDSRTYECPCGRQHRIGFTKELRMVVSRLRTFLAEATS